MSASTYAGIDPRLHPDCHISSFVTESFCCPTSEPCMMPDEDLCFGLSSAADLSFSSNHYSDAPGCKSGLPLARSCTTDVCVVDIRQDV